MYIQKLLNKCKLAQDIKRFKKEHPMQRVVMDCFGAMDWQKILASVTTNTEYNDMGPITMDVIQDFTENALLHAMDCVIVKKQELHHIEKKFGIRCAVYSDSYFRSTFTEKQVYTIILEHVETSQVYQHDYKADIFKKQTTK